MDKMVDFEGTVLPSYLRESSSRSIYETSVNEPLIFVGRVIKVHAPDDETNLSGRFFEYDVLAEVSRGRDPHYRTTIPRCRMVSAFGGVADFSRSTPRLTESKIEEEQEGELGFGSQVVVACLSGSANSGVILGGYTHDKMEKDDPSLGHHGTFQFNGIRFDIDKDGQLTLNFKGATKDDGALADTADANASGTTLTITKDGSFKVFTKDDSQHLLIDHKNKVINILADTDWQVKSKGKFTLESAQQTDLTVSTGNCSITIKAGQHLIDSLGVFCGAQAVDAFVKGTTYRIAETTMHTTMLGAMATLTAAGTALTAAAAALSAAGGTVTAAAALMKIPVAGAVAGSIPLQASGASLITAGGSAAAAGASVIAAASTMIAAISTFEGGTASYLSVKNFCD